MKSILLFLFLPIALCAQTVDKAKKLYDEQKPVEARKLLLTVKKESKEFAEAQYYLGRLAYDAKEYDQAEEYFEAAIEVNDKVADYHNWYGNTLGTIAGDANFFKQATLAPKMKGAWERALELDPKSIEARQSLILYYQQAPAIAGGSTERAIELANEIVRLKPAEGHRQLGNIYYREKKWAEAEKEFVAMVKADPSYTQSLANFYINQKNYEKASLLFEDQLKKNPEDMMAIYQLGKMSALSGQRLEDGEKYLRKYLAYKPQKNEPSHAAANMRLAQILEKRGKKAEAKSLYELALKSDATLKEAEEGLKRVSK